MNDVDNLSAVSAQWYPEIANIYALIESNDKQTITLSTDQFNKFIVELDLLCVEAAQVRPNAIVAKATEIFAGIRQEKIVTTTSMTPHLESLYTKLVNLSG